MPELYLLARDVSAKLEAAHSADPIALVRAKGALAARAGFLVALIGPNDPDDPEKVRKLREAAAELGIAV